MTTDPLAFLDKPKEDKLSFLDEVSNDPLSFLDESVKVASPVATVEEEGKTPIPQKEKSSIWDNFGKALSIQAQTIAPAPKDIPQIGAGVLEQVTLGAADIIPPKTEREETFRKLGKDYLAAPLMYGAIGEALTPLPFIGRLFGWGAAMGLENAYNQYFKTGEVNPKDMGKAAVLGMSIEAGTELLTAGMEFFNSLNSVKTATKELNPIQRKIQGLENVVKSSQHAGEREAAQAAIDRLTAKYDVTSGIEKIALANKTTPTKIFKKFWDATKNWSKQRFGKELDVNNLKPEEVDKFLEFVQFEEKALTKADLKPQTTPIIQPKIPTPTVKPSETPLETINTPKPIETLQPPKENVPTKGIKPPDYDMKKFYGEMTPEQYKKYTDLISKEHEITFWTSKDKKEGHSIDDNNLSPTDLRKAAAVNKEHAALDFIPEDLKRFNLEKAASREKLANEKETKVTKQSQPPKQQIPITSAANKPHIQPESLKQQKNYLLTELDQAIAKPPSTPQVIIKVPDDGTFKINNTPQNLVRVRDNVEKHFPTKPIDTKLEKNVKPTRSTSIKTTPEEHEAYQKREVAAKQAKRIAAREHIQIKIQQPTTPKPLSEKSHKTTAPQTTHIKPNPQGTKQSAKRSDIIKLFQKAFNDPLRLGKFRSPLGRKRGIHKGWEKVSRLLKANNVETAAHEIGHNLHYALYEGNPKTPREQRANTIKALQPYLNELKQLAGYEPFTLEGFAEFTRMYVTNPTAAQALAPKFYQKFEQDLDLKSPDLKNALLQAREYYDTYLQGTPQSRVEAQIAFHDDPSWFSKIKDMLKDPYKFDRIQTLLFDDIFPAKRVVAEAFGIPISEVESLKDMRNLYRTLRILKSAVGKADVFLLHETFDINTLQKTGEGFLPILKELKDDVAYQEFNQYLVARRTIEKANQNIETGISYSDALITEANLRSKFSDLAKKWDTFNDNLLQYVSDSGLISPNELKVIKDRNLMYAPFQRDMGDVNKQFISKPGSALQSHKPIKKMKGSTRDIIPPVESLIKNIYTMVINSEKNRAAQTLAKLAEMKGIGRFIEKVPVPTKLKATISKEEVIQQTMANIDITQNPQVVQQSLEDILPDTFAKFGTTFYPKNEPIITVYNNGKPTYYQVSPDIFEMWNKGTSIYTLDMLPKAFRFFAQTLRAGAVLNPRFAMKNFVKDTWGSWIYSRYGKSIANPVEYFTDLLYQPLAMLCQSASQGQLYVEWMKAGGGMSTMQGMSRDALEKQLDSLRKGYKPTQIIHWLRTVTQWTEEANRLNEFAKALVREEDTRLGKEIAAFAGRDLSIDFLKAGLMVKALNSIVPFFNAQIQGTNKLIRAMEDPATRPQAILKILSMIIIPAALLWWINKDDEDIKELSEQEKDQNFLFKLNDTILKIPVPFEVGVISNGLTRRMLDYTINKNPDAFYHYFGSIKDATLPNAIPTFALPFMEQYANKKFYTGRRIIPAPQEKLISKYQYTSYTSTTARLLGKAMNYMLGEETHAAIASPAIIDHFIRSWTGGLGTLMVNIADAGLNKAGLGDKVPKPSIPITERLGLDAFIVRNPRGQAASIEKFYDVYTKAISHKKSYDYAVKQHLDTGENIQEGIAKAYKIYDYKTLEMAHKALQQNQKLINMVYIDPSIDSDTKRKMIDDLYKQQINFCQQANKSISKYMHKQP